MIKKIAVITGVSQGIGYALAQQFIKRQIHVGIMIFIKNVEEVV